jgi:hypothetical protein
MVPPILLPTRRLTTATVTSGRRIAYGYLYIVNDRVVVLLNNVSSKADLGPLRTKRTQHVEPEADVRIFPRSAVHHIEIFPPQRKGRKRGLFKS